MANSNYARGRAYEYRAAATLRDEGYLVTRSSSSKGAFDLIAVGPTDIRLIQVKSGRSKINKKELDHLKSLTVPDCATIEVWHYPGNRKRLQVTKLP